MLQHIKALMKNKNIRKFSLIHVLESGFSKNFNSGLMSVSLKHFNYYIYKNVSYVICVNIYRFFN